MKYKPDQTILISIHALLAESDSMAALCQVVLSISIHALLAESDLCAFVSLFGVFLFLSTLSLRRATVAPVLAVGRARYFYPRSPCGERLSLTEYGLKWLAISIHALLAESDA